MKRKSSRWSYEGENGPNYWAGLDKAYRPCGEGRKQSPVDIPFEAPLNHDGLIYKYKQTRITLQNINYSIQADTSTGCTIMNEGRAFTLQQFHFHCPSEHTLAGVQLAMELHLVHSAANGALSVTGIFLVSGDENPTLRSIWAHLPEMADSNVLKEEIPFDPTGLLPENLSYYKYRGSLTNPPCTEGVMWIIMANPVQISADQLAAYQALFHSTNRPIQPMNLRKFE